MNFWLLGLPDNLLVLRGLLRQQGVVQGDLLPYLLRCRVLRNSPGNKVVLARSWREFVESYDES